MKHCPVCKEEKSEECFRFIKRMHYPALNYCCRECELKNRKPRSEWSKQTRNKEQEWEKKQRDSLSDWWIRKSILIESKGNVKTNQITLEMIQKKREKLLEWRFKKENHLLKKDNIVKGPYKCKCIICGIDFLGTFRRNNVCSPECHNRKYANKHRLKYKEEWQRPEPFECKECGELHQPEYGDTSTVFCSDTCRKRNERREKHQSGWAYRRYKSEKNGERFKVEEIYDRDRWKCGICHKKVNSRFKYPHPMSASLDHIIPIAVGGVHTKRNVQLAHLSCNVDIGIGGMKQLRMIG